MSAARHHAEWLSLVEVSGPFLSIPVLLEVFPDGLEKRHDDAEHRARLHMAHEEWLDACPAGAGTRPGLAWDQAIHDAWVRFVLREALDLDDAWIRTGQSLPQGLRVTVPETHETLAPDRAVVDPNTGRPRLLVSVVPPGQDLDRALAGQRWKASPATRMTHLLHGAGVRLGLVTNGDAFMLVHAAQNQATTYAEFYASLFFDEPLVLRAFASLLGARRLFGVAESDTLEALFDRSSAHQQDVTDQLGAQMRRAVETLIQTIDRIDKDQDRGLLRGMDEAELYQAACTVMMRLVFLLAAEERDLLLLGDPLYDQCYALSTLREQLQDTADRHGEEVLRRRYAAWSRLLALFRAVHAGVRHETLRLPAYGGSLFDPDRYPFLEGRPPRSSWRLTPARPLPVDDLTVLDLLTALQVLEVRLPGGDPAEARRLSFRALDVEQIGHVYEGLLDHTARRAPGPVVSLRGSGGREPEIEVAELEAARARSPEALLAFLRDRTGRQAPAIERALRYQIAHDEKRLWMRAAENSQGLLDRVAPWAGLVRADHRGLPVLYDTGALYVTEGDERRATGTHYTPPTLTEPIVRHTLEPLVYHGPAEGLPRAAWRLRSARDILSLRVCDPAMGSGAFLVQVCRYLAGRLVQSWADAERAAGGRLVVTPEGDLASGDPGERPLPRDDRERHVLALRAVADRCVYGVDRNPMAVEMAKLSLWLETLDRKKPFTFLDHALRCGDSLLGLTRMEQLAQFHIAPGPGRQLHSASALIQKDVARAAELRRAIAASPDDDIRDIERKTALLGEAEQALGRVSLSADLVIAAALAGAVQGPRAVDERLTGLAHDVLLVFDERESEDKRAAVQRALADRARGLLDQGRGPAHAPRMPFHWVLEFPEVLAAGGGFDAVVGNPPFQGGQRITGHLGTDYRDYLVEYLAGGRRGSADLCAYFVLRAAGLVRSGGQIGVLATNTIAQGDTREVGLDQLVERDFTIPRAVPSRAWPGTAAHLEVAHLWLRRGAWPGPYVLDDRDVTGITAYLAVPGAVVGKPHRLAANAGKSFIGSYVLGLGFTMSPDEARALIERDPRNRDVLFPYLNGEDLNSSPEQAASRWVINFRDWPLDRAGAPKGYTGPVAEDYFECLAIVREKVKPERDQNKYSKSARERWWLYERWRPELYATIAGMERVLVRARVANLHSVVWVPAGWVYHEKIVVFVEVAFSVMQSTLHEIWARHHSSTLRTDMQYTPSDCFDTFPFPAPTAAFEQIGSRYHEHRQQIMRERQKGLTATYNLFHDQDEYADDIQALRELHVEMDLAVARAYGWDDLDLGHSFHETKQGDRFTVSPEAQRVILDRLLALNHERHKAEEAAGLHEAKKSKGASGRTRAAAPADAGEDTPARKPGRKRSAPAAPAPAATTQTGFDFGAAPAVTPPSRPAKAPPAPLDATARAVLDALDRIPAPALKSDLVSATGLAAAQIDEALRQLVDAGLVTRHGKARGTRYARATA